MIDRNLQIARLFTWRSVWASAADKDAAIYSYNNAGTPIYVALGNDIAQIHMLIPTHAFIELSNGSTQWVAMYDLPNRATEYA